MQADIKQGLQTLATDVATQISGQIGPKLGEALDNHLVPVMKDLHTWMQNHMDETRNQQVSMLGGISDHITRLSQVMSTHFEDSQENRPRPWRPSYSTMLLP